MTLTTLKDLYIEQINDLHSAETQITERLPRVIEKTTSPELKAAFKAHMDRAGDHRNRLEKIFTSFNTGVERKKCRGMEGILEELGQFLETPGNTAVKDAGLIAAVQRIQHYQMAGYGCLRTYAEKIGRKEDSRVLQEILDKEVKADQKLTQIAKNQVNDEALQPA